MPEDVQNNPVLPEATGPISDNAKPEVVEENNSEQTEFDFNFNDPEPVVEEEKKEEIVSPPVVEEQIEEQKKTTVVEEQEEKKEPVVEEKKEAVVDAPSQKPPGPSEEEFKEIEKKALADLTASYSITDEEAESYQLNPKEVVPRALAQVHLRTVRSAAEHTARMIAQVVPQLIEQHFVNQKTYEDNIRAFTDAWPDLKEDLADTKSSGYMVVNEIGAKYRQLYPDASRDQFIKDVGAMAMVRLGRHNRPAVAPQQQQPKKSLPPYNPAPGNIDSVRPPRNTLEDDFDFTLE